MANNPQERSRGYQIVLTVDLIFQALFWGMPGLLASTALAKVWEVTIPKEVIYVRLLGAFSMGWAFLLWLALRDAFGNVGILRGAVFSHLLVAATVFYSLFAQGVTGYLSMPLPSTLFWWVTIVSNIIFAFSILFVAPRVDSTLRTAEDNGATHSTRTRKAEGATDGE